MMQSMSVKIYTKIMALHRIIFFYFDEDNFIQTCINISEALRQNTAHTEAWEKINSLVGTEVRYNSAKDGAL